MQSKNSIPQTFPTLIKSLPHANYINHTHTLAHALQRLGGGEGGGTGGLVQLCISLLRLPELRNAEVSNLESQ